MNNLLVAHDESHDKSTKVFPNVIIHTIQVDIVSIKRPIPRIIVIIVIGGCPKPDEKCFLKNDTEYGLYYFCVILYKWIDLLMLFQHTVSRTNRTASEFCWEIALSQSRMSAKFCETNGNPSLTSGLSSLIDEESSIRRMYPLSLPYVFVVLTTMPEMSSVMVINSGTCLLLGLI
jgi:hypothetical protein